METQGMEWALGAAGTSGALCRALRPGIERPHAQDERSHHVARVARLDPTFAVGNCSMNINGQVPQDAAGPQQLAGAWEGRGKVAPRASRCTLFAQQTPRAPSAAAPAGCTERCLHGRRTSSVLSRQRRTPTEQLGSGHASGTPRSPRNVA